jgi:hypothetical protein
VIAGLALTVQEDPHELVSTVRLSEHLVGYHVRVVGGYVGPPLEAQLEESVRAVEDGLAHAVQREVRLDLFLVHVVLGRSHLHKRIA